MANKPILGLPSVGTIETGTDTGDWIHVVVGGNSRGAQLGGVAKGNVNVTGSAIPQNGQYLSAANTLAWSTNSTRRVSLSTTAWTVSLPVIAESDVRATTNIYANGSTPSTYPSIWGTGAISLGTPYGFIGTLGGFRLGLSYNGYRNTGGTWTSLNVNSQTGASTFELGHDGIYFGFDSTTPSGTRPTERMKLATGLLMAGATGGDKGAGTINAVGVYDDNTLLTCMALAKEFREKGTVDLDYWDSKVPNLEIPAQIEPKRVTGDVIIPEKIIREAQTIERIHRTARMFKAMIDGGFDPRDPEQYFAKMQNEEALPGMPTKAEWAHAQLSTGEMLSRMWLAVEMLAIVTDAVWNKVKDLEGAVQRG